MSGYSKRIESLSPEKRALLERRLGRSIAPKADLNDHRQEGTPSVKEGARLDPQPEDQGRRGDGIDFSLFYFASDDQKQGSDRHRLLLEGAKFADRHGFNAVWTPERHFNAFGGLFPNPAVSSAALAMVTEHVRIRAGSVVLPLHHPVRVAEDWALVDSLSGGRVGLAFASGWHANDFVFFPQHYSDRREVMHGSINTVQRLWRGDAVSLPDGTGKEIDIRIFPPPMQAELPIWITAAGSEGTFIRAGERGFNLLTNLLGQNLEWLAQRIQLYREARSQSGYDPATGRVTLMLHTFVGDDPETVQDTVRDPFCGYLRSFSGLMARLASSLDLPVDASALGPDDLESLLNHSFDRYYHTSGLFGTPETCMDMVRRLHSAGVDEVACLVDFGVDDDTVLDNLKNLASLQQRANAASSGLRLQQPQG